MTSQEIEAALAAAREEQGRLQAELGGALLTGSATAALEKKLAQATAKLEEIERAASAIKAATATAAKAAAANAEREAQEALERRIQAAHDDLAGIHKAAAGVDKALADFDQAMSDLAGLTDDYLAKYDSLGINQNVREFFRLRGWCGEVLGYLKNRGDRSMRNYMNYSNILTYGSGKTIAELMPDAARVLTGRGRRKAAG